MGDQQPPRRPGWKPGSVRPLREFFRNATHWVPLSIEAGWKVISTFARAAVIFLFCAAIYLTIQQVLHARLVIEPISVPKQFEDSGITGEVLSNRIRDVLNRIESTADSSIGEDSPYTRASLHRFVVPSDQAPYASVEVAGTKFDLNGIVQVILAVVQLHQPDTVSGEVTLSGAANSAVAGPPTQPIAVSGGRITLRIKRGGGTEEQITLLPDLNNLDASVEQASEELLKQEDPYPLGMYRLSQGNPDSAIEIAQLMRVDGKADKAHQIAALTLWGAGLADKGQPDEALKKFQQVLDTLDRNSISAYNGLGIAYFNQGLADKAIENFRKAVELSRKSPAAHVNLANALSSLQHFDEANAEYQLANQLDPSNVKTYINWGVSLSNQKNYSQADEKFQQAEALDPNYAELYFRWGIALSAEKKLPEAIERFTRAIELNPKNDEAHNDLGVALYDQHKYPEAVDQYKKAIEILKGKPVPNYVEPYLNWGALLLDQHQYPEAIAKFMEALHLAPDNSDAKNYWGRALSGLHKYEEAIAKFKEVSDNHPQNYDAFKNWGDTLVAERKFAEAVAKYQQALALEPSNEEAQKDLQQAQDKFKNSSRSIPGK